MSKQVKQAPALRFPEFSGGWDIGTIKDFSISIIDGDRGINYPKSLDFTKSGYCLFLNAKNVTKRGFSFEELTFISQKKDIAMNKGKLKRFDIVLTTRGSIGQIGFYNENVPFEHIRINSGMVIIRSEKRASPNFLYVLFANSRVKIYIKRIAFGSAQLQLTVSSIKKIPVALPTIEEQRKIADFLSVVDNKIEQLSAKKASLEEYKKGMMQKLFSQKFRFKDDKGKPFPDWQEKKLDSVFHITRGNVLAVNKMTSTPEEKSIYPVYSSQTRNNGIIGYFNKSLYENAITWTTDGANAGDVKYRNGKFYCTNVCGVLLSKEGYANTCIAEMINLITKRYVSYVGNPKLMNNVMAKIKITFPHPEEQRKIADFLSAMDSKISFQEQHINIAREFKKSLLQQMLR